MDCVELSVVGVIGIKRKIDEPIAPAGLVGQLMKNAFAAFPPIEIQVGGEFPGSLVEDVKRPVQIVHEKPPSSAPGLLPQKVHPRQQAVQLRLPVPKTG